MGTWVDVILSDHYVALRRGDANVLDVLGQLHPPKLWRHAKAKHALDHLNELPRVQRHIVQIAEPAARCVGIAAAMPARPKSESCCLAMMQGPWGVNFREDTLGLLHAKGLDGTRAHVLFPLLVLGGLGE